LFFAPPQNNPDKVAWKGIMSCTAEFLRSLVRALVAVRRRCAVCFAWAAFVCALAAWPCVWQLHAQGQPAQVSAPPVAASPAFPSLQPGTTEEELRQSLMGKTLYLRGGFLDNTLDFDEQGRLIGHSPQGSYTLALVQIDKVRLTRRKVELQGARYAMHFLGVTPYEDPTGARDTVNITPKKKPLRITIARELVVTPKKKKQKAGNSPAPPAGTDPASDQPAPQEDQTNPGELGTVTTTTSPAHAAQLLHTALDRIFAQELDEQMIASMPDFWQLYYKAVAAHTDVRPNDPGVFRQFAVNQKARLLTSLDPPSNEYAQANGVAGMALYSVVIGADGAPQQIAVSRPIGFGLDENAVETIRKAKFQPALKDGKSVPVMLDVLVEFRIYSKRTAATAVGAPGAATAPAALPGPYSASRQ
jgi:TonB family protein